MKFIPASTFAFLMATSSVALADNFVVNGDTTGAPTWNRPIGVGPTLSGVGSAVNFQTILVSITDPLVFLAEITAATFDTYLHMYAGTFDPTAPLANLVAGDDDGRVGLLSRIDAAGDGPFAAGEYTIVVSAFANGLQGTYALFLDGVLLGWGATTAEQLSELRVRHCPDRTADPQGHDRGNVRSAVEDSMATRASTLLSPGNEARAMMATCTPG